MAQPIVTCDALNCYMSLTRDQRQRVLFEKLCALQETVDALNCEKELNVVDQTTGGPFSGTVPIGAYNYSIRVIADEVTVDGVVIPAGETVSGGGPLSAAVAYEGDATASAIITYETCVEE